MVDACKVSLEFIRHLAIDEADRMLTLGFASQVRNIEQRMPPKENRQTVLFSATMPEQIAQLAADFMKESVSLKMGSPDSERSPIIQIVKWVEEPRKRESLMQDIVGVKGKIIGICCLLIFLRTNSRKSCFLTGWPARLPVADKSK